jgi:hypothetical protein
MIHKIKVDYSEFCYFFSLSRKEQVSYFFSLYDAVAVEDIVKDEMDWNKLKNFFDSLKAIEDAEEINESDETEDDQNVDDDINDDGDDDDDDLSNQLEQYDKQKIDVMIDDEIIMMESNSIRAIRIVVTRFIEFGYILQRDVKSEKMFKRDKVTRFIRVFKIIDQIQGFSLS